MRRFLVAVITLGTIILMCACNVRIKDTKEDNTNGDSIFEIDFKINSTHVMEITPEVPGEVNQVIETPEPTLVLETGKLAGLIIGIDAGHQSKANREKEPVAPNSATVKNKVSSGTQGRTTGVWEYEVNLAVALRLQELLLSEGAEVIMIRTTNDVNISNSQRAVIFNDAGVDLGIRLHCNGSEDVSAHGAFMLVPADENYPYYDESKAAAECILAAYGEKTGISVKRGITYRSDQTGFNWCERPICNIEMGHLTNKEDEIKLVDPGFQDKMAEGIYNGVLRYFDQK